MKTYSNLSLDEIISIEVIGDRQTYDFVIPRHHNFIANGVLVHNSGDIEQDADVVFLLYRDDQGSPFLNVKMAKNRQLGIGPAFDLVWLADQRRYADRAR